MRTLEVLRLEPASETRLLRTMECLGSDKASDAVVDRVAENRSGEKREHQEMHIDAARGDNGAGEKKQRGAR